MKNRTASYIFLILSAWSAGYFSALEITSPSLLSFSFVWLFFAVIFLLLFLNTRRKDAEQRFLLFERASSGIKRILAVAAAVFCFIAGVNLFFICTPQVSDGNEQAGYLIVLGGGITHDGALSSGSKKRVQKAAEYMKSHPQVKAVVSGGKGRFVPWPESFALAAGLEQYGIRAERILQEDKALDTIQNFSYSAALIASDADCSVKEALSHPVIVVTSDFHLARSERIARREGYTSVYGIAADTPCLFILNNYTREILSYIKLNMRILLTGKPTALAYVYYVQDF
jgi:uncharacterized SAM-binding protein YcdF (DUF218 family)